MTDYFEEITDIVEFLVQRLHRLEETIERYPTFSLEERRFRNHKGELMSQLDDLNAGVAALVTALNDAGTRVSTDLTALNQKIAYLTAAGATSIPLTDLDPIVASVTGLVSVAQGIDAPAAPAPTPAPPAA